MFLWLSFNIFDLISSLLFQGALDELVLKVSWKLVLYENYR